jgi:hypothetical protein
MAKILVIALSTLLVVAVAVSAGSNSGFKMSFHVLPHEDRSCGSNWPVITGCSEISNTYAVCGEIDVFPVFYDLVEVRSIEYGIDWPEDWGSCVFTPCAGDFVEGDIVTPGDGVAHEWTECYVAWSVVTGYAWLTASSPGIIVPVVNPATQAFGTRDCDGVGDLALGIASAGVCGIPAEDPCDCGCPVEPQTWSAIKGMFR